MADIQHTPIRRVVTGHDSNNVAKVLIDGIATNSKSSRPGQLATLMWATDAMPADMPVGKNVEDMGARIMGTMPPVNGTRFSINEYPPDNVPRRHRTETIDYVIILSGAIDMELDNGATVSLKAGDVVIQRGTYHTWINRGSEICRIAFVLIDAKPLGIGEPVPREAMTP